MLESIPRHLNTIRQCISNSIDSIAIAAAFLPVYASVYYFIGYMNNNAIEFQDFMLIYVIGYFIGSFVWELADNMTNINMDSYLIKCLFEFTIVTLLLLSFPDSDYPNIATTIMHHLSNMLETHVTMSQKMVLVPTLIIGIAIISIYVIKIADIGWIMLFFAVFYLYTILGQYIFIPCIKGVATLKMFH